MSKNQANYLGDEKEERVHLYLNVYLILVCYITDMYKSFFLTPLGQNQLFQTLYSTAQAACASQHIPARH